MKLLRRSSIFESVHCCQSCRNGAAAAERCSWAVALTASSGIHAPSLQHTQAEPSDFKNMMSLRSSNPHDASIPPSTHASMSGQCSSDCCVRCVGSSLQIANYCCVPASLRARGAFARTLLQNSISACHSSRGYIEMTSTACVVQPPRWVTEHAPGSAGSAYLSLAKTDIVYF